MEIQLELNIPEEGRVFLNYWDHIRADDVVCELIDGKLMLIEYDAKGEELPSVEITISQFIDRVKQVAT